jgi:hypothetical protein
LERGIRELLGVSTPSGSGATAAANPTDGSGILKSFYEHPLIAALYGGPYMPGRTGNLPSYIPSLSFAGAVLDLAARSGAGDTKPMSVAAIRAGLATLPNERLRRTVLLALDAGGDDLQAVKAELARIFDASMDRVSGWYKRRTQWVLLALGLVAAVALNIDPIHVARRLAADEALRQAAVSGAEGLIASPPVQLARGATPPPATGDVAAPPVANGLGQAARDPAGPARQTDELEPQIRMIKDLRKQMDAIGFPIGWGETPAWWLSTQPWSERAWSFAGSIAGWLITALAVMLGAPFWLDVLNKFMVIRSTVKPREKSPEEGSEDRQPTAAAPVPKPAPAA